MRMTRSRAQVHSEEPFIHEDSPSSSSTLTAGGDDEYPQPAASPARPVLKDITITTENFPTAAAAAEGTVGEAEEISQPVKKSKGKRKVKGTKKDTEHLREADITTSTDSQIDEWNPAQDLPTDSVSDPLATDAGSDTPAQTNHDQVAAAAAVVTCQTPSRPVITTSKTPKFDPEIHIPLSESKDSQHDTMDDSFVDSIKTRSPSKLMPRSPERESSQTPIVDTLKARTPAKMSPRIEDSVEAMDALEDAIEKVSETLPMLTNIVIDSPAKVRKQSPAKSPPPSVRKSSSDTTKASKTPTALKTSPSKSRPVVMKAGPPRTMSGLVVSSVKPSSKARPVHAATTRPTNATAKPAAAKSPDSDSTSSSSAAKQRPNIVKKRVPSTGLSTSKPGFVPAKSSKPVTKSTFSLPGEAVAAKLKAQREERLKREEEAAEKSKTAFKARPAPSRSSRPSVAPRETKTSAARMSLMTNGSDKENEAPKPKAGVVKPSAGLSVDRKRPDLNKANSSLRRATTAARPSVAPRVSTSVTGQKSTVTKEDAAQQKVRGKEVFSRTKMEIERMEMERKEKEEAARKARAEAAERGRQASREWAEKQKKRLAAAAKAKTVSPGASPAATMVAATS